MTKIKVGVVGTGFIGPAHIEALRRLPNVEVAALCEVTSELAAAKAAQLGIARSYTFDELLQQEDIQVVHICTPNFLHYSQSKAALLAGKHVVCEKPLAKDLHEAEELVELAAQTGLVNAVHFNLRYYPLARQMKAMQEKGELGEVYSIMGSYLQDWLFYETDYSWRLEPDKSGNSRAIADIGSHLMDIIEYITGLKTVEVLADFNIIHKTRKKPLKPVETYSGKMLQPEDYADIDITTEDHANVLLRFNNGNRGVITVSQVSAGRKNQLKLEIAGSKQTFAWNSEAPNELWIGKRDGNNQVLMRDPSLVHPEVRSIITFPGGHNEGFADTSKQMFKEVYAAVEAGKMPENPTFPTFADGYRELLICEKILESNQKQAWVQI
ncbi:MULTISPECIES: Gfo/Idh/MocA family protein [unclassified Siphonobacter]|uniref:Gfo/Idh/MocA family protein n=1 Tax=unclassified Siphonobacter TaxID=2635712 RepID=UPI000CBF9325|nr:MULTISPECIES: Gfo/Idh/MocA family oxidoreductase [unclassified Siphonobacter]MDQ1088373.1 putative dehydrogenase [Siphonobacter sp. SORGH_AS_1065]MDR6194513.1 putative dehydrogenase [Siphonobacter sp. SORGH_AS_0500]PKK37797.1 dehydrogenase [Siphonobacter sp. SORGH_AS_0500]